MLVDLPVVEQRYLAVRAVLDGARVSEVAAQVGVSRQSVRSWVLRYERDGLPGLADRSHRPRNCPHQTSAELETLICEMRRQHPGWGGVRILLEMKRRRLWEGEFPSTSSVNRVLARHQLLVRRARRRRRSSFIRWERPAPMLLWQIDIVEGPRLVEAHTGELRQAKIVTGVDDHARFCVIAKVVERASGRAICAALVAALQAFGAPEEILTDNGRQFTARFGRGGEVLFDKICRRNGIAHRLTRPRSPTTTGKIERFHETLQLEFLDTAGPFRSLPDAQAALDGWVSEYNRDRPHQALGTVEPVTPSERFEPVGEAERTLLPLWVPPALSVIDGDRPPLDPSGFPPTPTAVEFDRVVPPSGNMWVEGRQIWLGPARAGLTVRFWADVDVIHVSVGGARIKTLRSQLSTLDLERLAHAGARPAGPSPLPPAEGSEAIELDRLVNRVGLVSVNSRQFLAAEILAGRRVVVRVEQATVTFFDPDTRQLLRTRPNPGIPVSQAALARGARPAGPPPRPSQEPLTVQRRASGTGKICVCRQHIALGRPHAGRVLTVHVSESTIAVELDDQEVRVISRTTTLPVRQIKADRPYHRKTSPP